MMYNYLNLNCIREIEISGRLSSDASLAHPDRILSVHDLVYVVSGGFNVYIEEELVESREGDIMFLPANKHHFPKENNLDNTVCYFIHFSCNNDDFISSDLCMDISNNYYCIPSKINVKNSSNLIAYFHEFITLHAINSTSNFKLLNSLLLRILSEIDLCIFQNPYQNYNNLTLSIISYLEENLQGKASISQISEVLSFAPRTIQKHFKDNTGVSIHEYHLQMKLTNSKYYLISYPEMKLKEIASMFGFYDEFHYSKAFKKMFNISPNMFRIETPQGKRNNSIVAKVGYFTDP